MRLHYRWLMAAFAAGIAALSAAAPANAQLPLGSDFLTPAVGSASQGQTFDFFADLVNNSSSTVYLNSYGFSLDAPAGITSNAGDIFFSTSNVPFSLDPTVDSGPLDLFDLSVADAVTPGSYAGTYTFYGGADGSASDMIGQENFNFTVTSSGAASPVPEPPFFQMTALLGLGCVGLLRMRDRKRPAWRSWMWAGLGSVR